MTILPPGLQTRRISLTTWTGSGTTLTRYGAYTMSKVSSAMMQRRAEDEVIDVGELFVNAGDEVVLDGGNGEGARRDVRTKVIVFTVEQHYGGLRNGTGCPRRSRQRRGPFGTIAFSAVSNK